jgi:hypothetical protein
MGILDRLGRVIKSYLNDDGDVFGKSSGAQGSDDPYMKELDDYLNGESPGGTDSKNHEWSSSRQRYRTETAYPESLAGDFAELGLPVGASAEECKIAYKRLLKIHHPDRHAGHPGNMQKATEKSARINAAYDRIKRWRLTGEAKSPTQA